MFYRVSENQTNRVLLRTNTVVSKSRGQGVIFGDFCEIKRAPSSTMFLISFDEIIRNRNGVWTTGTFRKSH